MLLMNSFPTLCILLFDPGPFQGNTSAQCEERLTSVSPEIYSIVNLVPLEVKSNTQHLLPLQVWTAAENNYRCE